MNADEILVGGVQTVVMAAPLCISVHLAFRCRRRTAWKTVEQRSFWRVFYNVMVLLGALFTLGSVLDAAMNESGTQWGKATVGLWFGYPFLMALSAVVASIWNQVAGFCSRNKKS